MKNYSQLLIFLFFVLIFTSTTAQNLPTFEEDVIDNPAAPINDYLPHVFFTAVTLGFYFFRKEAQKKI